MSEKDKGMQCRYCTNSKEEGEGIQMFYEPLWICVPCFEKFKAAKKQAGKVRKNE